MNTFGIWLRSARGLAAATCVLAAAACGDDDHHHDPSDHVHGDGGCGNTANCHDTLELEPGLRVESADGRFTIEVIEHEPLTPQDNSWLIAIEDEAGDPVEDAELSVDVFSTDCMHGGPDAAEDVSADDDGRYALTPTFAHGGPWETVIEIEAGGASDTVRVPLCVHGEAHH